MALLDEWQATELSHTWFSDWSSDHVQSSQITKSKTPKITGLEAVLVFTLEGTRKFHYWTHASVTLVLDHLSTIPINDYTKELPNFGFSTVRNQIFHIFNCEGFWIHTLQGLHYADCGPIEFPAVADARLVHQEVSRRTEAYLSSLTDQQLNTTTELHFSDGDRAVRTPAFILHHVMTHAFHHKGQIVAMCRALGHPAPDTDLSEVE